MDSKRCFKRWGAGTVIINSHFSTHLNYLWQVIPTHYIPFHLDSNLPCSAVFLSFYQDPCESLHLPVGMSNISGHLGPVLFSIFTCSQGDIMQEMAFG